MPYVCIYMYLKKEVFSPPLFFIIKLTQSSGQRSLNPRDRDHSILGTEIPHLSICISYKHPILINLLLAYQKKKKVMLSLHIGLFTTIHLG